MSFIYGYSWANHFAWALVLGIPRLFTSQLDPLFQWGQFQIVILILDVSTARMFYSLIFVYKATLLDRAQYASGVPNSKPLRQKEVYFFGSAIRSKSNYIMLLNTQLVYKNTCFCEKDTTDWYISFSHSTASIKKSQKLLCFSHPLPLI